MKKCAVKGCFNNNRKHPDKYFFYAPRSELRKRAWIDATGMVYSISTNFVICEDHFDMKDDIDYEGINGRQVLKHNAVPHRNLIAQSGESSDQANTSTGPLQINRASQTDHLDIPPYKPPDGKSIEPTNDVDHGNDEYDDYEKFDENCPVRLGFTDAECRQICKLTVRQMERNQEHYTGVPKESPNFVQLINDRSGVPIPNILLVLRKLRHNESFPILGDLFGISSQHAGNIFLTDMELIGRCLRPFINYAKQSKATTARGQHIHPRCFELFIGQPSTLLEETLSWSSNVQTTTVKHLIGCTADGLIVFVSEGFFGRISDDDILRESGFLDFIGTPAHLVDTGGGLGNFKLNDSNKTIENIRNFAFLQPHSSSLNYKRSSLIEHAIVIASVLCNLKTK